MSSGAFNSASFFAERLAPRLAPEAPPAMSDEARESAIVFAGEQLMAWMQEWERSGCFSARGCVDYWNGRREELIRGRASKEGCVG